MRLLKKVFVFIALNGSLVCVKIRFEKLYLFCEMTLFYAKRVNSSKLIVYAVWSLCRLRIRVVWWIGKMIESVPRGCCRLIRRQQSLIFIDGLRPQTVSRLWGLGSDNLRQNTVQNHSNSVTRGRKLRKLKFSVIFKDNFWEFTSNLRWAKVIYPRFPFFCFLILPFLKSDASFSLTHL